MISSTYLLFFFSSSHLFSSHYSRDISQQKLRFGVYIAGPPPPSSLRYVPSFFDNNSAFSSLVDSRRIVSTDAAKRPSAVDSFFACFSKYNQNLTTVGIEVKDQRY